MEKVTVKKSELLDALRHNRKKHVEEYEETVEEYKAAALQRLDNAVDTLKDQISKLKGGDVPKLNVITFDIKPPEFHKTDYDRAIQMLEMAVDENITIVDWQFQQFVMDNWDWKDAFQSTRMSYSR